MWWCRGLVHDMCVLGVEKLFICGIIKYIKKERTLKKCCQKKILILDTETISTSLIFTI